MRLVYIGWGWCAGIVLADKVTNLPTPAWAVLSLALLIVVYLTRQTPNYRLFNVALLALTLGGLRYSLVATTSEIARFNNTGGLTIEGVITSEPDIRDDRTLLRVRVDKVISGGYVYEIGGNVLVRATRRDDANYGDRVAATGLLYTPGRYDAFSYADYLARQNVFSLMDHARVEIVSTGHGNPFFAWLYDRRRDTADTIGQMLPEPAAGLLTGILLGNENGISPELSDDFQAVGASHIIAISGFNMVIIAGVVQRALRQVIPRREKTAACLGIIVIAVYTIFAGANAAVVRAAIMSSLLILGQSLRRNTYVPASLLFTALVMSLHNPTVLWDVSFQLSFFAVLGLAFFADPIQNYFNTALARLFPQQLATRTGQFLAGPIFLSLAVQITTLPVVIFHFGRFSLVFLVVNVLILPIQAHLLIIGGFATLVAFLWSPLAQALYWMDYLLLSWTIYITRLFAQLSFTNVSFYIAPTLIYTYFSIVIGGSLMRATQPNWWLRLSRRIRNQMIASTILLAGFAIAILMGLVAFSRPDGKLQVWFLDVGHSNAVLLETPGGANILIDGGQYPSRLLTSIGDRLPFTDREIEVLVISQPDEYDTGALPAVLNRYKIGIALTNGQPNQGEAQAELDAALSEQEVVIATTGTTIEVDDGVWIEVWYPQETPGLGANMNDYPLVLRVTYGAVSFLLPSDLSQEAQATMLEAGVWPLATVLQLPQHATVRSLDTHFLAAVQPQAIVLQSDPANRRGDPDPDVLAMLPENVPLFRTDQGGVIHIWTDGSDLWVEQ